MTMDNLIIVNRCLIELSDKTFNGEVAFRIARLSAEVQEKCGLFDKQYQEIITKYSELDENGNLIYGKDGGIKLQEDKAKECEAELAKLLAEEVELVSEKIPFSSLSCAEITPKQAAVLSLVVE